MLKSKPSPSLTMSGFVLSFPCPFDFWQVIVAEFFNCFKPVVIIIAAHINELLSIIINNGGVWEAPEALQYSYNPGEIKDNHCYFFPISM